MLEPHLAEIQRDCRAPAAQLRGHALAIDADPSAVRRLFGSAAFELNRMDCTPPRFRNSSHDTGRQRTCLERVVIITALSRGDAGAVLGCPGPALAGLVVDLLGDDEQQEHFYRRISDGSTWTFFAMSEPVVGSDATGMRTTFTQRSGGDFVLSGRKRYVGNGDRGGVGVVFGRVGPGVLGIRAALVTLPSVAAETRTLPMLGLRGAGLSDMVFDHLLVPRTAMLGSHLPATRRGLWSALRTFAQVRIQIGGMAIGTAQAMHDYVRERFPATPSLAVVSMRIQAALQVVFDAARSFDSCPDRTHPSSAAKLAGTRLVTDVADWAMSVAGPGAWAEHPLLEKWARDARGFEFMDGTGNMQRLAVARGYLQENTRG